MSARLINKARQFIAAGDFAAAIACYTEAIELASTDADLYLGRGATYLVSEQFQAALDDFTAAIDIDSLRHGAFLKRGETLDELGEYELAIADKSTAIKLDPDNPNYYNSRAFSHYLHEQYKLAALDDAKAIQLAPNELGYRDSLQISYRQLTSAERAVVNKALGYKLTAADRLPIQWASLRTVLMVILMTVGLPWLLITVFQALSTPVRTDDSIQIDLTALVPTSTAPTSPTLAPPSSSFIEMPSEKPLSSIAPSERLNYYSKLPQTIIDPNQQYEAEIVTDRGAMRFRLFSGLAPIAVNNFVFLATEGYYDNTTFHRVIEDFMAQGGDPSGTGRGGPGYLFANEVAPQLKFNRRGLLAMANAGPGTNGSQFFITHVQTPWLDGSYTIFGELISGDDILDAIRLRDPASDATPGDRILTIKIYVTDR